jgi:hypothetical protein
VVVDDVPSDSGVACSCPPTDGGSIRITLGCFCSIFGCPSYDAYMARVTDCARRVRIEEFRTAKTIIVHEYDLFIGHAYVFDRTTHAFLTGRHYDDTLEDCTGGDYDTSSALSTECDVICVGDAFGTPHCTTPRDAGADAKFEGG